jgi:integrase
MLNSLPKKSERIYPIQYLSVAKNNRVLRKSVARRLNNPRILKITLVTFRHWAATMAYHQTRDILLVRKLLGHKKIENTMKYTQLIQFKDSEFEVATAQTVDEAKAVISAGFEFIIEKNGIMLFRKPKRFVSC